VWVPISLLPEVVFEDYYVSVRSGLDLAGDGVRVDVRDASCCHIELGMAVCCLVVSVISRVWDGGVIDLIDDDLRCILRYLLGSCLILCIAMNVEPGVDIDIEPSYARWSR
jgi:hypothetical protein